MTDDSDGCVPKETLIAFQLVVVVLVHATMAASAIENQYLHVHISAFTSKAPIKDQNKRSKTLRSK